MRKKTVLIPLLSMVAAAGLLSGCQGDLVEPAQDEATATHTTQPDYPEILDRKYGKYFGHDMTPFEARVRLSDGREVLCLGFDGFNRSGWSCDWANATTPTATPKEEAK